MVTYVDGGPQRDGEKCWVIQTQRTTEVNIHTDDSPREDAKDIEKSMAVQVNTGDMK